MSILSSNLPLSCLIVLIEYGEESLYSDTYTNTRYILTCQYTVLQNNMSNKIHHCYHLLNHRKAVNY